MAVELLAPGLLADDVIRLALRETTQGEAENDEVPAYRFAVLLVASGECVGGISLRVGCNSTILQLRGQVGFTVYPQHRGNGFARRACALLLPFARRHALRELWITCDPENAASRRTLEALGAELMDVVEVPSDTRFYAEGSRQKCRYRLELA
ncbi:MAG TPA: GNAT family N-acetyltransferase [Polyangiaceae bacterium]|nr:GNAT family N-acetyltransferase [Polyangiaceae bacterium]